MAGDHSPLISHLSAAVLNRERPGWRRREITPDGLDYLIQHSSWEWPRAYVGSHHVTIPDHKIRLIVRVYPELVTTGELAREYLRQCWEKSGVPSLRFSHKSGHPYWSKVAPILVRPVRHTGLAYVDLDHAYWSILRGYSADHCVGRSGEQIPGCVPFLWSEEVDSDRWLRHAVVGTLFAHRIAWLRYGEWVEHEAPGQYSNPSLLRICYDTLQAIVRDIDRRFTLYGWLTDACIVKRSEASDVRQYLLDEWSLGSHLEAEGMGALWSPSCYRVGFKASRDIINGNAHYQEVPFSNLYRVNVKRMKEWRRNALRDMPPGRRRPVAKDKAPVGHAGKGSMVSPGL